LLAGTQQKLKLQISSGCLNIPQYHWEEVNGNKNKATIRKCGFITLYHDGTININDEKVIKNNL
jgi:exopolysaccharide biosynthesis protein